MDIADILKDIKSKEDLDNVIKTYGLNYQDSQRNGFLHELAKIGRISMAAHLFDRQRKERYNINLKNNKGRTALFEAFDEEMVEFLLMCRIDYNCKDDEGKKAEEVNAYVNFMVNQKCNDIKKKLLSVYY